MNPLLLSYLSREIFPEYRLNDPGHRLGHIRYVIRRSLNFAAPLPEVNPEMVYVVAAYHDLKHHIDHKNHERLSAAALLADPTLPQFFSPGQIQMMAEAVEDHRSTSAGEPRSIYGKIVSSADRNTSVAAALTRSYQYRLAHAPAMSAAQRIEESRQHLLAKFGPSGYAVSKIYFPDPEYDQFLRGITALASNPAAFALRSREANNLK